MSSNKQMNARNDQAVAAATSGFLGHPRPLASLFFVEMWERFSFYGIRPLLVLFMTATVFNGGLNLDTETAGAIVGIFTGGVYLSALPGGWLADNWLGQQRAVWYGSVLIALGHLSIALGYFWGSKMFFIGLALIVLGSGLFKTCLAVMVGTLYKKHDTRRDAGFSIFYMGINLGGFIAPFLTGWFANLNDWHIGFGIGGIGMLVALVIFRLFTVPAMKKYAKDIGVEPSWAAPVKKVPYVGNFVLAFFIIVMVYGALLSMGYFTINPILVANWLAVVVAVAIFAYFFFLMLFAKLNAEQRIRLLLCFVLLLSAACFWAAFEQQPTSFNLFTEYYVDRTLGNFTIPTAWIQTVNPLIVIIFAPLFAFLWVGLQRRNLQPSSTTKFIGGLLLAAIGFAIMIFAAKLVLATGGKVSLLWIIMSFMFLTFGELSLSPVGLSAMTHLAPKAIRGQVMGLWNGASALGNVVAGLIGGHVAANSVENLPSLFGNMSLTLCICAVVLLVLAVPINRALKNSGFSEK